MNRTVMNRFALGALTRTARALTLTTTLAALALLSACAGGSGAPTTVNQVATAPSNSAADYTGPPPANADVQAFKLSFWQNVIPSNRCGGCHHAGGQSPQFARSDDVNLAYQAALPLVNLTNPSLSTFVTTTPLTLPLRCSRWRAWRSSAPNCRPSALARSGVAC